MVHWRDSERDFAMTYSVLAVPVLGKGTVRATSRGRCFGAAQRVCAA